MPNLPVMSLQLQSCIFHKLCLVIFLHLGMATLSVPATSSLTLMWYHLIRGLIFLISKLSTWLLAIEY
ncbi:hypothetical protein Leryth_018347 [Lithospermum erythrorhizon]|nr:hypothetical protein Leryth_018347 [Lithospermum erythrorhizon]